MRLYLALLPIIIIQICLLVYALVDIVKPERQVKGGNKTVWILIIALVNLIGPILYLTIGREGERWDGDGPPDIRR